MATTKTQSFNNKIKAPKYYLSRQNSGVGGLPSSSAIQTTLKYFFLTLKKYFKGDSFNPK